MESIRPICIACNISIVRDHDDRILRLLVQRRDELHDLLRIALVEIPCRLIGEEVRHVRDECSRDSDTLCFSS